MTDERDTAGAWLWRERPVFVSSTFRDMHAERDHLARFVFPELAERLRARRHDLVAIDLRWGVETSSHEAEAKELLVLKVCLAEIERSRPFFIALLGDRYGWVAPEERVRRAADEAGFDAAEPGMSITALEIEYGALATREQQARTFVYVREPLPYDEMPAEIAALYSDARSPEAGAPEAAARLTALKGRLAEALPGRVRPYRAEWDAARHRVVGLEGFGRMVLEDLWAELEAQTASFVVTAPMRWQQAEGIELETFIADRARSFVGRDALLDGLEAFADPKHGGALPDQEWGRVLVAGPGSGKSAVFAALARRLRQRSGVTVLAHSSGVSPRARSVESMLRRWVAELAESLDVVDPALEITARDDLEAVFAELLSREASQRPVVMLVDALDQFEPTTQARHVAWLPSPWPRGVRLVATTVPGTEADALARHSAVSTVPLEPLEHAEARAVVARLCARDHRTLPDDLVEAVVTKPAPDGGPASGNPLWLQLAVEALLLLDEDDFARLPALTGSDEQRLHALLAETIATIPGDPQSAYGMLLGRAEDDYGRDLARAFANLVTVSSAGLRESDLRELLPAATGTDWDELAFASLRRGFRGHLTQRGLDQWDFRHQLARRAVYERNLAGRDRDADVHRLIAEHLAGLPDDDPMAVSELMYHLIGSGDPVEAAAHLSADLNEAALEAAVAALAEHTIHHPAGLDWLDQMLAASRDDRGRRELFNRCQFDLLDACSSDLAVESRVRLMRSLRLQLLGLWRATPDSAEAARDLSVSHNKLGDLYVLGGDLDAARDAYQAALAIAQDLARRMPESAQAARDLSVSHNKLGDLYVLGGDLDAARDAYQAALTTRQDLARRMPESGQAARDLSVSHNKLGDLYVLDGDLDGARGSYQAALAIAQGLARRMSDSAEAARDLSISHNKLGDLHVESGDLDAARDAYQAALSTRQGLARRMPDSAEAARDLSISHNNLGDLYTQSGDLDAARDAFQAALAIAQGLARRMSDSAEAARDLSISHNKLGDLCTQCGDLDGARDEYQAALTTRQDLARRMPDSAQAARDLSISHNKLGDLYVEGGDLGAARDAYQAALTTRHGLARRMPESAQAARDLSISYERLGDLYLLGGDLDAARDAYQAALAIAQDLARRMPESAQAARDLSVSHNNLGDLYVLGGDLDAARDAYQAALTTRQDLARRMPDSAEAARDLSVSHNNLGDLHVQGGDLGAAREAYQAALLTAKNLAQRMPDSAEAARDLSISYERLADLHLHGGDLDAARDSYQAALAIAEGLAGRMPDSSEAARDLSITHNKLGDLYMQRGQLDAACDAYQAALSTRQDLARRMPESAQAARDVSLSHERLGNLYTQSGDLDAARAAYQGTLTIAQDLARRMPDSAQAARHLSVSHRRMAQIAQEGGDAAGVERHQRIAWQTLRSMRARGMHLDGAIAEVLGQLDEMFDGKEGPHV